MKVLCTSELLHAAPSEIDAVRGGDMPTAVGFIGGLGASTGAVCYAIGAGVATVSTGGIALAVYAGSFLLTYTLMRIR